MDTVDASAIAFASRATAISTSDPRELEMLNGVDGIDVGEAVLFSRAKGIPAFVLTTGDKPLMKAVRGCDGCWPAKRCVLNN